MQRFGWSSAAVGGLAALAMGGCPLLSVLNPDFVVSSGLSDGAASLPGEAPTLLVQLENRTGRPVDYLLTWRDGDGNPGERLRSVRAGETTAEALPCPISEITLGQVGDPSAIGALVVLGEGNAGDPFIAVEPFGRVLQEGINYNCGDSLTFSVRSSGETASGYQAFAFIRPG